MTIKQKDIEVSQGETTTLFFKNVDSYGNGIDLTGQKAILAIKRYPTSSKLMLLITDTSVINGGQQGEFTSSGYGGTGGSYVNQDSLGSSLTGGIRFSVDKQSMTYVPHGRHFYEVSLRNGAIVDRLFEGRIDVRAQYVNINETGIGITASLPNLGTTYYVGSTAPTGAELNEGDRWWNTEISAEFVYLPVVAGGSYTWVQVSAEQS